MQICPDFLQGKCTLGVYCRLEHPTRQALESRADDHEPNSHGNRHRAPFRHGRFYRGVCRHCHHEAQLSPCHKCRTVGYCGHACRIADQSRHHRHCLDASSKAATARLSPDPVFVNPAAPVLRPAPAQTDMRRFSQADHGRTTPGYSQDTKSAGFEKRDGNVFDNHHAYAPRSLEMMVGMPFQELRQRSWLAVRNDPLDVRELLRDAFCLRKYDNRRHGGKDAFVWSRGHDTSLHAQWTEFVDLCERDKLLPLSMDSMAVKESVQMKLLERNDLDPAEIISLYDDVRMPLQMRIFAGQVMGYDLVPLSEDTWADLLEFEQWEWAGSGFEWKVVFGQK